MLGQHVVRRSMVYIQGDCRACAKSPPVGVAKPPPEDLFCCCFAASPHNNNKKWGLGRSPKDFAHALDSAQINIDTPSKGCYTPPNNIHDVEQDK